MNLPTDPSDALVEHKTNACNDAIQLWPMAKRGDADCPSYKVVIDGAADFMLNFQDGPIKEVGVNGITNEALLAVVLDRMRRFQSGPFACRENALVITKLEEAMHWLHHRTRQRELRGVEGTNQK